MQKRDTPALTSFWLARADSRDLVVSAKVQTCCHARHVYELLPDGVPDPTMLRGLNESSYAQSWR